jgi:hypothetical protein
MKCYVEFPCDDILTISAKIYEFLQKQTTLLDKPEIGWQFIDCNSVLKHIPELALFFKKHNLLPRHAAVTIIETNEHLPRHIDELPVIAKLNLPVINTKGWINRWYVDNKVVAEYADMPNPIIFNSQIEHSVEKIAPEQLPRIIASFTFHNEPLNLLT